MVNFEYVVPTQVVFGKDTQLRVAELVSAHGGTKVLVHFGGSHVVKSGLLNQIHQLLSNAGIAYVDCGGVVPNPRLELAEEAVELGKREGVDFILAIGGGSVMDSAKAIAYGLANDVSLEDLYLHKVSVSKAVPLGVISTIAGTGSETSDSSVMNITLADGRVLKRSYHHQSGRPCFAIMNPELTYSVSAYQTASTGADIMMHTMERYFTLEKDVALTDELAEGLLRTVKEAVLIAVKEPENYAARADLLWASSLSHCGLTGTGRVSDFASHAIEHELSAKYDVAHGAGLTAIWASWARYVMDQDPERFAQFAVNVFGVQNNFHNPVATGLAGIEAWNQWCHAIGMPTSLTELGVDPSEEDILQMAEGTIDARGGDHAGNFMQLKTADVQQILRMALK